MKTPESLEQLVEYGIIEEVVRPLMSGKEAQIYVVMAHGEEAVAKVYKEASQRTFKHRAEYTEGRRTRNTRDQRAINKRTQHGRKQDEAAWRSAEVDMIARARLAGVRVPEALNFVDGVLVMELVKDEHGNPAPRLGDLAFSPGEAREIYQGLIQSVVRLLCAGVIHGDLSDFNVLMAADGPVFIDFPQAIDPASNQNARKLLLRDVDNLHRFLERHVPEHRRRPFGQEMWALYEANRLHPDTALAGDYRAPRGKANTDEVLALIADADAEEQERRDDRGEDRPLVARKPQRVVVDFTKEKRPRAKPATPAAGATKGTKRRRRGGRGRNRARQPADAEGTATATSEPSRNSTRRRKKTPKPTGDPKPAGSSTDTERSPRRRRRRPRSSGPRKTT
jgi:RIO kinase 1